MKADSSPLLLGIDTGGTFTDCVLLDVSRKEIISSSKAPTTHRNLVVGISESLKGLNLREISRIKMVGLSTTLATNAIVEQKGRPTALIIVGYEGELTAPIPALKIKRVSGGHTVRGKELTPLDEKAVREFVVSVQDEVDAFACASYFSVRNPEHEDRVEKIIGKFSKKPVILGHRLSMDLNAEVRATTAALNAGLIPLITELIDSVKMALTEFGISAPMMVVKGDGSLMGEETALMRPIETILSGPAASVIGAMAISPGNEFDDTPQGHAIHDYAIVVDIGGTTTDIALIGDGGLPNLSARGAKVGAYRTFIHAVDVRTLGLGGDSFIDYSDKNEITLGPTRVLPLGRLAVEYPGIRTSLKVMKEIPRSRNRFFPTDFIASNPAGARYPRLCNSSNNAGLIDEERELFERIVNTPLPHDDLGAGKERFRNERSLERLIRRGLVIRAGLTPTDVFNHLGLTAVGDIETSRVAVEVAASFMGIKVDLLIRMVIDGIKRRLVIEMLSTALKREGDGTFRDFGIISGPVLEWLEDRDGINDVIVDIELKRRLIAVGAPAEVFIAPAAGRLNARYDVPGEAAVASAIGAVSGVILVSREAYIRNYNEEFVLFTADERKAFSRLEGAKQYARKMLISDARQEVMASGGSDVKIKGDWEEQWVGEENAKILIESRLCIRAVGRPDLSTVK